MINDIISLCFNYPILVSLIVVFHILRSSLCKRLFDHSSDEEQLIEAADDWPNVSSDQPIAVIHLCRNDIRVARKKNDGDIYIFSTVGGKKTE